MRLRRQKTREMKGTVELKKEHEFGLFIEGSKVSFADYYLHLNRYRFAAGFVRNKVCLDIACGTGYGSVYLSRNGAKKVIGGDKSEGAISYAMNTTKAKTNGALEFQVLDAASLPFADNSFGAVISFEVIEHLKDYEMLLAETHRVLGREGTLILSTPNRLAGPFGFRSSWNLHTHEFCQQELLHLVQRYFGKAEVYGQDLLSRRSLILKRVRQTAGRLLEVMGLRTLEVMLGRLFFKHNRLIVYREEDFDNLEGLERLEGKEGEVERLADGLTATTFVMVATKS